MDCNLENSVPDNIRPYVEEITRRLWSGHAVLMVGSGFSKNAVPVGFSTDKLPDWSEVGDAIYKTLHGNKPNENSKYKSVPDLAFQMESMHNLSRLEDLLKNIIPDSQFQPSPLHVKLLELPWADVFTTNFDTLLERASKLVNARKYDVVINKGDLGLTERPRIIKLHGSFTSDGSLVITDEHYRQYSDVNAHFVNTVHQALLENTLCLLGFSGHDPNFLHWIGWIRDTLGQYYSPKIYNIGLFDITEPERKALEQKNIVLVDLSKWQDTKNNHYEALDRFLDSIQMNRGKSQNGVTTSRNDGTSGVAWPVGNDWKYPKSEMSKLDQLIELIPYWRNERRTYPGWITVPVDIRATFWNDTEHWCGFLSVEDEIPSLLDLEFTYELSWRMEKSLSPFYENQIHFIESVLEKYIPLVDDSSSVETVKFDSSLLSNRGLSIDDVRSMVRHLLLRVLRFYREEGLLEKWRSLFDFIAKIEDQLPLEIVAQLRYEKALFALFELDFNELREILSTWPETNALPHWELKKAGLYAEIGDVVESRAILNKILSNIRSNRGRQQNHLVYSSASQEALAVKLLDILDLSKAWKDGSIEEYQETTKRSYQDNLESLKPYKCDPMADFRFFESSLNQPYVRRTEITEKEEYDIGRYTRNFRMAQPIETSVAFSFLRYCEDTGLPFRAAGIGMSKDAAEGAITRILDFSPFWAIATLFRIGDAKVVDRIFNRLYVSQITGQTADNLAQKCINGLEQTSEDINSGDNIRGDNIGIALARVIPEVLSRLCSKCSMETKLKLVGFLQYVYESENRKKYTGIRNLTERLLNTIPIEQRIELIPTLLDFPILDKLTAFEKTEYVNPFRFLEIGRESVTKCGKPSVSSGKLKKYIESANTGNADARKWSLHTLSELYDWGCLDSIQRGNYADALWSQVDEFGLPDGTDFRKAYFLELPHPIEIQPFTLIRSYIYSEGFPIQDDINDTGIQLNGLNIPICHDIIRTSRTADWTNEDSLEVLDRLIEWWDADKSYLRRVENPGPFGSIRSEFEERFTCLVNVGVELIKPGYDFVERIPQLLRLLDELSENGIPALRLESACIDVFPDSKKNLFLKIERKLASDRRDSVIDSLRAVLIVTTRNENKNHWNEYLKILNTLGQIVRFQKGPCLYLVFNTIALLVDSHPTVFRGEFERLTLIGLKTTALSTGISAESNNVSEKLNIRQHAASLAYELYRLYTERGTTVPQVVLDWRSICASGDEFAEIRNQWLG